MNVSTSTPHRFLSERAKRSLVLVLAALSLTAVGCGSDSEPQESDRKLSASQYRQIERLYRVQVTTEQMQEKDQGSRGLRMISKACAAVDRNDPLLAAAVAGCGEMTEVALSLADMQCDDTSRCTTLLRATARKINALVGTMRQAQRTVTRLLADDGCSDALAAPPEFYLALEALSRGLREMATSIDTGDDALAADATESLNESDRHLKDVPSANALLSRFRETCAA